MESGGHGKLPDAYYKDPTYVARTTEETEAVRSGFLDDGLYVIPPKVQEVTIHTCDDYLPLDRGE